MPQMGQANCMLNTDELAKKRCLIASILSHASYHTIHRIISSLSHPSCHGGPRSPILSSALHNMHAESLARGSRRSPGIYAI